MRSLQNSPTPTKYFCRRVFFFLLKEGLNRNKTFKTRDCICLLCIATGCETGWLEFKGHCYYKGHTKVNWPDAKVNMKNILVRSVKYGSLLKEDYIKLHIF